MALGGAAADGLLLMGRVGVVPRVEKRKPNDSSASPSPAAGSAAEAPPGGVTGAGGESDTGTRTASGDGGGKVVAATSGAAMITEAKAKRGRHASGAMAKACVRRAPDF